MAPPSSGMAVVEEWNILVILDLWYYYERTRLNQQHHVEDLKKELRVVMAYNKYRIFMSMNTLMLITRC